MVVVGFMIAAKAKYNKLNCYLSCGSTPTNRDYKASSSYVWGSGSVAVVVAGFNDHGQRTGLHCMYNMNYINNLKPDHVYMLQYNCTTQVQNYRATSYGSGPLSEL